MNYQPATLEQFRELTASKVTLYTVRAFFRKIEHWTQKGLKPEFEFTDEGNFGKRLSVRFFAFAKHGNSNAYLSWTLVLPNPGTQTLKDRVSLRFFGQINSVRADEQDATIRASIILEHGGGTL